MAFLLYLNKNTRLFLDFITAPVHKFLLFIIIESPNSTFLTTDIYLNPFRLPQDLSLVDVFSAIKYFKKPAVDLRKITQTLSAYIIYI